MKVRRSQTIVPASVPEYIEKSVRLECDVVVLDLQDAVVKQDKAKLEGRRVVVDALRKGRRPEFDPEDPAFVPAAAVAPDDAVQSGQIRHRIREALKQLPEDQATVIRLSFFEDKPHGEVADQLALPLGTVKSRLRLAMRRIRTLLGD